MTEKFDVQKEVQKVEIMAKIGLLESKHLYSRGNYYPDSNYNIDVAKLSCEISNLPQNELHAVLNEMSKKEHWWNPEYPHQHGIDYDKEGNISGISFVGSNGDSLYANVNKSFCQVKNPW